MDVAAIPVTREACVELPLAVALRHAWLPITDTQKDGSWIWAVMDGINDVSGKPYEPTLVRWKDGCWYERDDRQGYQEALWQLTHYLPLPTPFDHEDGQ